MQILVNLQANFVPDRVYVIPAKAGIHTISTISIDSGRNT